MEWGGGGTENKGGVCSLIFSTHQSLRRVMMFFDFLKQVRGVTCTDKKTVPSGKSHVESK